MQGTGSPQARPEREARPGIYRTGWLNLASKVFLALVILLFISFDNPIGRSLAWAFQNPNPIQPTLLLWGGVFVWVAGGNLFEGPNPLRRAWAALSVGAYAALAVPGMIVGTSLTVDALGPVAALTLVAHLGRRDLPRALRDWALVVGLSLYAALGVQAMWLVVSTFGVSGPLVFLIAVLVPPLVFEAALLLLRRLDVLRQSTAAQVVALVLATVIAIAVSSVTLLNRTTPLVGVVLFYAITGLLIGGALFVSLLTRPMIEAASGAFKPSSGSANLGRALVELSHGPILISLSVYLPLRLLSLGQ